MQNFDASSVGAGLVELGDIGRIESEARRLHDVLHLLDARGAGDRRGDPGRAMSQASATWAGVAPLRAGDLVERGEDAPAAVVRDRLPCARRARSCRDPLPTGTCRSGSRWRGRNRG